MKPLPATLAFLAIVAAVVAMVLVLAGREGEQGFVIEEALPARGGPDPIPTRRMELPKGGVYAGRVVDEDDKPVPGATVLLVAYDAGDVGFHRPAANPQGFDPSMVAIVGFRTAAETKTDAAGRFRVAADADSAIRIVFAHRMGYGPRLVGVTQPQEGLKIVLPPVGRFIGHVVDDETSRPIPFAVVAIYLQQKTAPVDADVGGAVRGQTPKHELTWFAAAQKWVAKELGPRVWGVDWQGDESVRVMTDKNGRFEFGPVMEEVQLEFIITHADYKWTEQDRTERGSVERTVVPAGQTVERTFRLKKGKSISGKVVDENNRGVADVLVSVDHVAQYAQHWWYRVRQRRARTRRDGSFRVAGLSYGPYTVTLKHDAFGTEHIPGIPEGATNLELGVKSLGAIRGTLLGVEKKPFGVRITVVLESAEERPDRARHVRRQVTLDPDLSFLLPGVRPGRWRAWVQMGGMSSQPQTIEVTSLDVLTLSFELGGGGAFQLRVWDAANREVDPATVSLIRLDAEAGEQRLGRFVTRGGRLDADGIVPARYVAEVSAPGYMTARTEPFLVGEDAVANAGDVVLRQPATLRIADIQGPDGRTPTKAVHLSLREGDGGFRSLPLLGDAEVVVKPGFVTVRAVCDDGSSFEETFEVLDGSVLPITVRLRR